MLTVFPNATVHCVYHSVHAVLALLSGTWRGGAGGVDLITTARRQIISAPPTRPFSLSHLYSIHPAHKLTNGFMGTNTQLNTFIFNSSSAQTNKQLHGYKYTIKQTEVLGFPTDSRYNCRNSIQINV
jgi:hypothetical protein